MKDWKRLAVMAAAVFGAAFIVRAPSLFYGFVFDERILIQENPLVHSLGNLGEMLTSKFWPGPARGVYYRPVVVFSYALGYELGKNSPFIHHLLNVLGHAFVCLFFFFCARRIIGRSRPAFVAALVFALHPIHAESVVWIPGRTDVLSGLFILLAFLFLLRAREAEGGFKWLYHGLCSGSFLFALGAKEVGAVFPLLVLAYDLVLRGRKLRNRAGEYAWLFGLLGAFLLWRAWVLGRWSGPAPAPPALNWSLSEGAGVVCNNIMSVLGIFARAFNLAAFPLPWRPDFAYAEAMTAASPATKSFFAFEGLLLLLLAFSLAKRARFLGFCLFGFLLFMAPVSHVISFPTLFAERFLYVPSAFVCLAAGRWLAWFWQKGRSGNALLALFFLVFGTWSVVRAGPFQNEFKFWRAAAGQAPQSALAWNWLGIAYRNQGRLESAEKMYRLALLQDEGFIPARMNLAEVLLIRGETRAAVRLLEKCREENPDDPRIRVNLGLAYEQAGMREKAREEWKAALLLEPDDFMAHLLLARSLVQEGKDLAEAQKHLEAAARLRPSHPLLLKLKEELRKSAGPR